jgi:hypothetical protein
LIFLFGISTFLTHPLYSLFACILTCTQRLSLGVSSIQLLYGKCFKCSLSNHLTFHNILLALWPCLGISTQGATPLTKCSPPTTNVSMVLTPCFDDLITTYSPPIQGSTTSTQGSPPSTPSSMPSLTQGSMASKQSFNNFFTNEFAQSRNCRWISCRKNTGYHMKDPKI